MSTFRKTCEPPNDVQAALVDEIKTRAEALEFSILRDIPSRERALAMTKLEEAVMWAVKGITR
jgi:hypothetical protein